MSFRAYHLHCSRMVIDYEVARCVVSMACLEQTVLLQGAEDKLNMIRAYRSQVEKELRDICSDILNVLDKHLIPSSQTGESKVFYYKMKVSTTTQHTIQHDHYYQPEEVHFWTWASPIYEHFFYTTC